MIKINFSQIYIPMNCSKTAIKVDGTKLIYNNEEFDLSEIPDGATVNHPVIQNCTRNGDDFELTLTVNFTGQLPENYGRMEAVEVQENWELEYEYTSGNLEINNDLA